MKSKIEKLNIERVFLTGQAEEIMDKINELIDHLNSQSQPEEKPVYVALFLISIIILAVFANGNNSY